MRRCLQGRSQISDLHFRAFCSIINCRTSVSNVISSPEDEDGLAQCVPKSQPHDMAGDNQCGCRCAVGQDSIARHARRWCLHRVVRIKLERLVEGVAVDKTGVRQIYCLASKRNTGYTNVQGRSLYPPLPFFSIACATTDRFIVTSGFISRAGFMPRALHIWKLNIKHDICQTSRGPLTT